MASKSKENKKDKKKKRVPAPEVTGLRPSFGPEVRLAWGAVLPLASVARLSRARRCGWQTGGTSVAVRGERLGLSQDDVISTGAGGCARGRGPGLTPLGVAVQA